MAGMDNANTAELLEVAAATAVAAGRLVHEKFNQPREITYKGFRDVVTDADLAAQQAITGRIRERFPTHGFLTEEKNEALPRQGPVRWVIDPIDGTTNYSRQQPIFCVSVAAVVPAPSPVEPPEVLAGVIYDPMRDELFAAARGDGCTLNGRRVTVSDVAQLKQALVSLDWSHSRAKRQSTLDVLPRFAGRAYGVRAIGSAALAMAWVAAGRYDVYINYNLKPWDVAAAMLLVAEAGGTLSDTSGPLRWSEKGMTCVVSNGRVHDEFLETVRPSS